MSTTATTTTKLFIDGGWTESTGDELIDVFNPTTAEVIASVPRGTVEDVSKAVAAARRAYVDWSRTSIEQRAGYLRSISEQIQQQVDEIARVAAMDIGTPVPLGKYMHGQLPAMTFSNMADNIEKLDLETRDEKLLVLREPVGVVGCITPWNYPLHQIAAKIAPALAAGCTVVVKPSEIAPLTPLLLAEIIEGVGLPDGVFNLISGYGPLVGEALAQHPGVDMVSFTGSVRAGTRVAELAAGGVKRVTLELGGKSPNVVLDDVDDLASIVSGAVKNAYMNSGQTCSALTRLIVPRARLKEVEDLAREAADSQRVGDPAEDATDLGPVVSEAQYERVRAYITKGLDEGATLVIGGLDRPEGSGSGYFIAPTVFSDVRPDMVIAQEEIFGPVLSIMPYDTEKEAIEIANGTPYGLSGAVWSGSTERAERVARDLRTGQVKINGGAFNPAAPFGGYGKSGIGRELGPWGLEEFFETKALTF